MSKNSLLYLPVLAIGQILIGIAYGRAADVGMQPIRSQPALAGLVLGASDTLSSPSPPQDEAEQDKPEKKETNVTSIQFAGYAKSFLIHSKTVTPNAEPYTESVNRLRLKITYDISPHLEVHIEHDTEVKAGNYLGTADFRQNKNAPVQQYWNEGSVLADKPGYYATQHLFRAYVKISDDATDVTVGRQRIALGTGRLWSALDMLNPVNPLQIERDEYVGVDAALLEYKSGALAKLSLIYAPDPARTSDRWIGQYRTNLQGADFTFTAGKYWTDHILGADIATQIGDAGLHGEITYTIPQNGRSYRKLLLGADYAFANTLTLSAEAYYSGQSQSDRMMQFAKNPQLMQVSPSGNRYAGFIASYNFTPLLKASTTILFNLSDHSRFMYPALSYSLTDNMVITGGVQIFSGAVDSEYGQGSNLTYAQFQWFF